MLAYGAVEQITSQIESTVCKDLNATAGRSQHIVIYDQTTFAAIQHFRGFITQLELLQAAFQSFIDANYAPSPTNPQAEIDRLRNQLGSLQAQMKDLQVLVAALMAQLDALRKTGGTERLTSFFPIGSVFQALTPFISASTVDKSSTFILSDTAIAMSITHNFKSCSGIDVIYPKIALPTSNSDQEAARQAVMDPINTLFRIQRTASVIAQIKEQEEKDSDRGTAPATQPLNAAIPRSIIGSDYEALAAANGLLNTILASYAQMNQGTGFAEIDYVRLGAELLNVLSRPDTNILMMEASAAGGTQRDRKNLITSLAIGDIIRYSGGAIVAFGLFDAQTGKLLDAQTLRYLSPQTGIKKPKNGNAGVADVRSGDNFRP